MERRRSRGGVGEERRDGSCEPTRDGGWGAREDGSGSCGCGRQRDETAQEQHTAGIADAQATQDQQLGLLETREQSEVLAAETAGEETRATLEAEGATERQEIAVQGDRERQEARAWGEREEAGIRAAGVEEQRQIRAGDHQPSSGVSTPPGHATHSKPHSSMAPGSDTSQPAAFATFLKTKL